MCGVDVVLACHLPKVKYGCASSQSCTLTLGNPLRSFIIRGELRRILSFSPTCGKLNIRKTSEIHFSTTCGKLKILKSQFFDFLRKLKKPKKRKTDFLKNLINLHLTCL